jgi:hypothetical protein
VHSHDALFWRGAAVAGWTICLASGAVEDLGANSNGILLAGWKIGMMAATAAFTLKAACTAAISVKFGDGGLTLRKSGLIRSAEISFSPGEAEDISLLKRRIGGEAGVNLRTKFGVEVGVYRSWSEAKCRSVLARMRESLLPGSEARN